MAVYHFGGESRSEGEQAERAELLKTLATLVDRLLKEAEDLAILSPYVLTERTRCSARSVCQNRYDPLSSWLKQMLLSADRQLQRFQRQYSEVAAPADEDVVTTLCVLRRKVCQKIGSFGWRDVPLSGMISDPFLLSPPLPAYAKVYRSYRELTLGLAEEGIFFSLIRQKQIDWSVRNVLIGSLGSEEQLADNLARRYYYVPEENLEKDAFPVSYVALYQSKRFSDPGIRYYGLVTETKRLQRKKIRFPLRRKNGNEWYYAFRVQEWRMLPKAIEVKEEGVFHPKLTNLFLLTHCTQSYELFHVHSEAEYALLCEWKKILVRLRAQKETDACFQFPFRNGCILQFQNSFLQILDRDGACLTEHPFAMSDAVLYPREWFATMLHAMESFQKE